MNWKFGVIICLALILTSISNSDKPRPYLPNDLYGYIQGQRILKSLRDRPENMTYEYETDMDWCPDNLTEGSYCVAYEYDKK